MTITTNQDRALTAISAQRVKQILGDPYGDKTVGNYLNPRAFELPAMGTLGNVRIGSVLGPGTWQFDAAVSRAFPLTEGQRLEFRAEAFNVTNSPSLAPPNVSFGPAAFGTITRAFDPRVFELVAKVSF